MAAPIFLEKNVEIGNGEGSFVGLKIEPGIKYHLVMKADVCLANLAQDPSTMKKSSKETFDENSDAEDDDQLGRVQLIMDGEDGPLHWSSREHPQARVQLHLIEGDDITLYVKGNGTYYLCGYKNSVDYSSN